MTYADAETSAERSQSELVLGNYGQAPGRMVHEVLVMPHFEVAQGVRRDMACEEELGRYVAKVANSVKMTAREEDLSAGYPHHLAGVFRATAMLEESSPLLAQMPGQPSYLLAIRRRTLVGGDPGTGDVWHELLARPAVDRDRPSAVVAVWDFEGSMHHAHGQKKPTNGNQADYKKYLTSMVEIVRAFATR